MAYSQRTQQIRTIFGLAKSEELRLTDDELYSVVIRETGKDSISKLTSKERNKVISELIKLKDIASMNTYKRPGMATDDQVWKIRELEKELGWDDNPRRLEGFVRKYYKVEKLEWLKFKQAVWLIESLKKMVEKQGGEKNA